MGREEWTEEKVRGGAMAAHTHSLSLSLARGWNVPESFEEAVAEMDAEAVEAEWRYRKRQKWKRGRGRGRGIGGIRWRVEVWEVVPGRWRWRWRRTKRRDGVRPINHGIIIESVISKAC